MKRKLSLLLAACLLMTGCGASNQPASEQPEAGQTLTTVEAKEETTETEATTTVTETTAEITTTAPDEHAYTEEDIKAAQTWMTKVWNSCVDIDSYVKSGIDCKGNEIDMDFYMKGVELEYQKRDEYDAAVHALDDSVPAQEMFILAWEKCLEQSDALLDKAFNEPPRPNDETYEFNLDLFKQYSTQLRNYMNDMMYGNTDKVVVTAEDKIELVFKK